MHDATDRRRKWYSMFMHYGMRLFYGVSNATSKPGMLLSLVNRPVAKALTILMSGIRFANATDTSSTKQE